MKCIILAGGEGLRMRPLTENTPKPLLKILDKPILEHILNSMPEKVNRVILVVGYLHHKIHNHFGHHYGRLKIDYVVQPHQLGTYNALELCKDLIEDDEKFIVTYADDIHGAENFKKCAESENYAILTLETEEPEKFGIAEVDSEDTIISIEEKPENPKSNLASTGVLVLDKNIFKYPAHQHSNGEYYIPDAIDQMIQAGYKFKAIKSNFWLPIGYPSDIEKAEQVLKPKTQEPKHKQNTKLN